MLKVSQSRRLVSNTTGNEPQKPILVKEFVEEDEKRERPSFGALYSEGVVAWRARLKSRSEMVCSPSKIDTPYF